MNFLGIIIICGLYWSYPASSITTDKASDYNCASLKDLYLFPVIS